MHTVKRVIRVSPDGVWVEGDNAEVSRDSRHFGVVPHENVLGVLRWRLMGVTAAKG
jgi:type IV secretory pathway protease TraF